MLQLPRGYYAVAADFENAPKDQFTYKGVTYAVVGKGNGHVCLGTAEGSLKLFGLHEAQIALGGKAEHQLAKGNNFFHHFPPEPVKRGIQGYYITIFSFCP